MFVCQSFASFRSFGQLICYADQFIVSYIYIYIYMLHILCNIKVRANIAVAQAKQKKEHQKKIEKGLKSYIFKEGDMVLRRNMLKLGRKGLFKAGLLTFYSPLTYSLVIFSLLLRAFKVLTLVYSAVHNSTPRYISDRVSTYAPSRTLRSAT